MKFILDSETFDFEEYDSMVELIKNKKKLEKYIKEVKSNDENVYVWDDITFEIEHKRFWLNKEDKDLIVEVLERLLIRIDEEIETAREYSGLKRLEE